MRRNRSGSAAANFSRPSFIKSFRDRCGKSAHGFGAEKLQASIAADWTAYFVVRTTNVRTSPPRAASFS